MLTSLSFFFFNHPATTEIYTLSLHDALPICLLIAGALAAWVPPDFWQKFFLVTHPVAAKRSEEHTSELQSHSDLVCRLLLEKKKTLQDIFWSIIWILHI